MNEWAHSPPPHYNNNNELSLGRQRELGLFPCLKAGVMYSVEWSEYELDSVTTICTVL